MTQDELQEMIDPAIERKLLELLGDPDQALPLRKTMRLRLARQIQAVASGKQGVAFQDVTRDMAFR